MTTVTSKREFPLAIVLSITSGKLFCSMDKLSDFLEWHTGHPVWSHDIVRLSRYSKADLIKQHPFLSELGNMPQVTPETVWDELAKVEATYGKTLNVSTMPSGLVQQMTPQESIEFAAPGVEVVTFEVES